MKSKASVKKSSAGKKSMTWDIWLTFGRSHTFMFNKPLSRKEALAAAKEEINLQAMHFTCGPDSLESLTHPSRVSKDGTLLD